MIWITLFLVYLLWTLVSFVYFFHIIEEEKFRETTRLRACIDTIILLPFFVMAWMYGTYSRWTER